MVDNYEASLNALKRFIYTNAPAGAERDLNRLEERTDAYFCLEFRRGDVSVTLYVEVDRFASNSFLDEHGNRWRHSTVTARPSWPSWGSVDLDKAEAFSNLLQEVCQFAKAILVEFVTPWTSLIETAEAIAERKRKGAEDKCRADVQALIRANMKGMRVGQGRRLEVPGQDLLPLGRVEVTSVAPDGSERHYTTNVTATRTIYVMRTA